jgi:hypothetical protein
MVVVFAPQGKENAVDQFITKQRGKIPGTISCFDRMLFKGHLPLGSLAAMKRFLPARGCESRISAPS